MKTKASSSSKIPVSRPSLTPLDELMPYLESIWDDRVVTNAGKYHQEFESALGAYLGVEQTSLVSNGTLGLVLALKALDLRGEVITTPFSFVATSNALIWAGLKPVYVDVDPLTLNIDPQKIEDAITPSTSGILPVHVFGRACDVESIENIANRYDLKTMYDAAHAFAPHELSQNLASAGDISVFSFHATKIFNTGEGGAVVARNLEIKEHLDALRNNGINGAGEVIDVGLNAKMSEIQAAMGLLHLPSVTSSIAKLKLLEDRFRDALKNTDGITFLPPKDGNFSNHGYCPIFIGEQYPLSRDALWDKLKSHNVLAKRYFYPLIPALDAYREIAPGPSHEHFPIAARAAESVLCLPMLTDLSDAEFGKIISLIA